MIHLFKIFSGVDELDIKKKIIIILDESRTRGRNSKISKQHCRLDLRKYFLATGL